MLFFGGDSRFMPLRQQIKQISCEISNNFEIFTIYDFLRFSKFRDKIKTFLENQEFLEF